MSKTIQNDWTEIETPITPNSLKKLSKCNHINKLYAKQDLLLTADIAKKFGTVKSIEELWLWCDVTKAALRYILAIPKLKRLHIFCIKSLGKTDVYSKSMVLETFYCAFSDKLSLGDYKELLSCKTLKNISLMNSDLNIEIINLFLKASHIKSIELEDSNFNDRMAICISKSKSIEKIELGGTLISRIGLEHICNMNQLQSLDIWNTKIQENDLNLLTKLQNLEYLSLGQGYDDNVFGSKSVINSIEPIKSLKRLWLDGIKFDSSEISYLKKRYEKVQISYKDTIETI